jgi:hypothetical protein
MKKQIVAISLAVSAGCASAQTVEPTYKGDPSVYKLIYEDANFRVIEANRAKGVRDKAHSHPANSIVYNVTNCNTKVVAADGSDRVNPSPAGTVTAVPLIPSHTAENIDSGDCKQVFVEKK